MIKKKIFGKIGEDLAVEFLKKNQFEIVDRNFTIRGGEIDIIALKNEQIRFVEVKTRINENWQQIEDSISDSKLEFINNAAEEWFFRKNYPETFWQIDFIGIILGSNGEIQKIVHLEDI